MKLNIFPCRLTLDVPVTDGETALAVAAANIVGSIVRTRFSSPELSELRAGFLKLRQSGALFEKPAAAIFPGLLVAACYSTGKTEFTGVPEQAVLERALAPDGRAADAGRRRADGCGDGRSARAPPWTRRGIPPSPPI